MPADETDRGGFSAEQAANRIGTSGAAPTGASPSHRRLLRAGLTAALALAVAATLAIRLHTLTWPFVEDHGWVQAHFLTMARTFAREGQVALGGVPVQNNPPLADPADAYLHWPPLLALILSYAVEIWGSGEGVLRAVMLGVLLANAGALLALVWTAAGVEAGLLAAIAWLTAPIIARFGVLATPLQLAILGGLVALTAYLRAERYPGHVNRWSVLAVLAMAFGVASSWEVALVSVGLVGAIRWRPEGGRPRLAVALAITAALTGAGILAWYAARYPAYMRDLWHTILMRSGLESYRAASGGLYEWAHTASYDHYPRIGLAGTAARYMSRMFDLGAPLLAGGLFAAIGLVRSRGADRTRPVAIVLISLLSMWVLWFLLMRNHSLIHDFQMLTAAPAACAALGIAIWWLTQDYERIVPRAARTVPAIALPIIASLALIAGGVRAHRPAGGWSRPADNRDIAVARKIRAHVPPGTVVLTPEIELAYTYYSDRHVIRGIKNDDILAKAVPQARAVFPDRRAVLALPSWTFASFPRAMSELPEVYRDTTVALLELGSSARLGGPLEEPGGP